MHPLHVAQQLQALSILKRPLLMHTMALLPKPWPRRMWTTCTGGQWV